MTLNRSLLAGIVAAGACLLTLQSSAHAQRQQRDRSGPRPVARNLDNPTGIAIHPRTGHIFVADRAGVHRVYRVEGERRRQQASEITGFPTDIYGKGPMYDIGPLGLAFMDDEHLVVGDGSQKDVDEVILIFDIADEPPAEPQQMDHAEYTLGPLGPNDMGQAEGNYYAVAVTDGAIYATANGDDTKGWIVKAELKDGKPGELKRGIATKEAVGVDAPVALTTDKSGNLVVGQMGEINLPGDSLLSIYSAESGELLHNWETGLNDITGLAYSPTTGKLYATDFAWLDTTQGGLFELMVKDDEVEVRKVAELDKPTTIVFDAEGNAYVAVIGTAEEGSDQKPGRVLRFRAQDLESSAAE